MPQFDGLRFQPSRPLLKEISADRLNTILAEIRKNRPKGERGITVRQSGDGTYIGLAASVKKSGAASETTRQPWDIYVTATEGQGASKSYTLKVVPGTIARYLAANWDNEFTSINDDTLYYGIARISTDGSFITEVNLVITSETPNEQAAEKFGLSGTIDIVFGLFRDGLSYNVVGAADIEVTPTAVLAVNANPAPLPGQSPFDIYYRLQ